MPSLVNYLASEVGGSGGGNKSYFAQAGTSNAVEFKKKWDNFAQLVKGYLKST
jgi:alanyl-tRNA synthetase